MNRINPLHISLFLVLLFFVAIFKLHLAKTGLNEAKKSYKESLNLAVALDGLKNTYTKKIIIPSSLRGLIAQRKTKDGLVMTSKKLDIKSLNLLMGKVMNGAYNVTKLNITRLSDTQASLYMEIKW